MSVFWRSLYSWGIGLWNRIFRRPKTYQVIYIEDDEHLPRRLSSRMVYILGVQGNEWLAEMVCPCGCGEIVFLNLLQDELPNWQWRVNANGVVTLSPSIQRKVGCKSHFFVREGTIQWCEP